MDTQHFHVQNLFSRKLRAHSRKQYYSVFFSCFFTKLFPLLSRFSEHCVTQYETVIRHTLGSYCGGLTRNVKTLAFQSNGPDFVASRDIMRVCERAYVRVDSRLTPGVRVSLHPLDQYSAQWRSTVSFSHNYIAISFAFKNAILRLLRTRWR